MESVSRDAKLGIGTLITYGKIKYQDDIVLSCLHLSGFPVGLSAMFCLPRKAPHGL